MMCLCMTKTVQNAVKSQNLEALRLGPKRDGLRARVSGGFDSARLCLFFNILYYCFGSPGRAVQPRNGLILCLSRAHDNNDNNRSFHTLRSRVCMIPCAYILYIYRYYVQYYITSIRCIIINVKITMHGAVTDVKDNNTITRSRT